jgi:iron complex transport system substrate-binding protein
MKIVLHLSKKIRMNKSLYHCLPLLLLMVALLPASCLTRDRGSQAPTVMIEDALGRNVALPARIERIVGLRPGALRLLAYMGATDQVTGIEQVESGGSDRPYMIAHPELLELPFVGPRGGDNERIIQARPDVIFITYASAAEADALSEKTGTPVVALDYPEIALEPRRLYASLTVIGKVLHQEARADSLIAYVGRMIQDLDARTSRIPEHTKPSVYIGGIAHGRARGITSTHPDYPPFVFVNARNVAKAMDPSRVSSLAGAYIDLEQLLLWDPDVIFIDESGLHMVGQDLKAESALAQSLTALRTKRVYALPVYNSYAANYETALIDSWYVGKILYPEAFADVVVEEKADEILHMFLGQRIFHKIITPDSFTPLLR